ncbi:MAG: hypothetical protein AAF184_20940 [Pseudomonadota bacterium]
MDDFSKAYHGTVDGAHSTQAAHGAATRRMHDTMLSNAEANAPWADSRTNNGGSQDSGAGALLALLLLAGGGYGAWLALKGLGAYYDASVPMHIRHIWSAVAMLLLLASSRVPAAAMLNATTVTLAIGYEPAAPVLINGVSFALLVCVAAFAPNLRQLGVLERTRWRRFDRDRPQPVLEAVRIGIVVTIAAAITWWLLEMLAEPPLIIGGAWLLLSLGLALLVGFVNVNGFPPKWVWLAPLAGLVHMNAGSTRLFHAWITGALSGLVVALLFVQPEFLSADFWQPLLGLSPSELWQELRTRGESRPPQSPLPSNWGLYYLPALGAILAAGYPQIEVLHKVGRRIINIGAVMVLVAVALLILLPLGGFLLGRIN